MRLQDVPGLRVSPSGGPGGNASVFIRGTNSDQVLVLRDGMPINDAADPSGAFNFGVDTLADVERIEVIRGPMAALYGSGAIGGVINLITRRGTATGRALGRRPVRRLPGADPRQRRGVGDRGAGGLRADPGSRNRSAATTARRSASRSTPARRKAFATAPRL